VVERHIFYCSCVSHRHQLEAVYLIFFGCEDNFAGCVRAFLFIFAENNQQLWKSCFRYSVPKFKLWTTLFDAICGTVSNGRTPWLIAITGARGAGKTTLRLQYIKEKFGNNLGEVFYASL